MSKRSIWVFAVAVGLLSVSMPLFAHHGTAAFDMNKTRHDEGYRHGMGLVQSSLPPSI